MEILTIQDLEKELKTIAGESVQVTPLGSLGLMALGDIGLMLWRAKRQEVAEEMIKSQNIKTN